MYKKTIIGLYFFLFHIYLLPARGTISHSTHRYDGNGNTVSSTSNSQSDEFRSRYYFYNTSNYLIESSTSLSPFAGEVRSEGFYTYNYIGMRTGKITGDESRRYIYDGRVVVIEKSGARRGTAGIRG